MKFAHNISKGSRFNQIYIPKEMNKYFEIGDLVEIKLLKKKNQLHYSKNLPRLSEFKEKLIKDIFTFLTRFDDIKQVFIVGSFLTKKIDYNDIDILIISEKKLENIYNKLINRFNLPLHIITISGKNFTNLQETCPLTISMLHNYISNKKFSPLNTRRIDKDHIKFLLMLPEDLLEIKLNSRTFYDNIKRLIAIENFLDNKDINSNNIEKEIKNVIESPLLDIIKKNEELKNISIKKLRSIIDKKLNRIKKTIQNGQESYNSRTNKRTSKISKAQNRKYCKP